jgi:uncharacterized protein YicC (UPF0701 family)
MNKRGLLNIFISLHEIEVLKNNTRISAHLVKKMIEAMQRAKQKRQSVKRVRVSYSLKELDKIIAFIADKANQKNSSDDVQYALDNMFGKFAEKYNSTRAQLR